MLCVMLVGWSVVLMHRSHLNAQDEDENPTGEWRDLSAVM